MARCPYLEFEDTAFFLSGNFYCKLCRMQLPEIEVKNKCKTDWGDQYEECPVYKNR